MCFMGTVNPFRFSVNVKLEEHPMLDSVESAPPVQEPLGCYVKPEQNSYRRLCSKHGECSGAVLY